MSLLCKTQFRWHFDFDFVSSTWLTIWFLLLKCSGATRMTLPTMTLPSNFLMVRDAACLVALLSHGRSVWVGHPLQNTSVSPDGKLLKVLGDSSGCLIADAQSGKVRSRSSDHSFIFSFHAFVAPIVIFLTLLLHFEEITTLKGHHVHVYMKGKNGVYWPVCVHKWV
jgi:hypothetical protein